MKASILIVEDEAIVAASLANMLGTLGYGICGMTGRGEEAVELVAKNRPDLVLMDILLAGTMDGIAAAEEIRKRWPVPIIYVTAHSDRASLERAKITEPFAYILKPFDEIELETHIQMALYKHASEQKLRESEERFRIMTEATFEGIALTENGIILDLNEQFSKFCGFTKQELVGKDVAGFLLPEDRQRAREAYSHNEAQRGRYRGYRKDGTLSVFDVSGRPFVWQGRKIRIMAIRDVTDLDTAERELKDRNRQIQQQLDEIQNYYDTAPVGLCVFDTSMRFIRVNERMAEINGTTAAEHIGRTFREVVPQLADMAEELVREIIKTGEPVLDIEFQRDAPEQPGSKRYWLESLYPIKNDQGTTIGVNAIAKEITDLKRAQMALRESEERLQLAIMAAKEAIWDLNLDDGSFSSNEEYKKILGQPPEDITPVQWWLDKIHPDDRDRVLTIFEKAVLGKNLSCTAEYRLQRSEGSEIHVHDRALIARTADGEPHRVVGAMMDITERKQYEAFMELYFQRLSTLIDVSFDIIGHSSIEELLQCVVDAARNLTSSRIAVTGYGYKSGVFTWAAVSKSADMPATMTPDTFATLKGGIYLNILKHATPLCYSDVEMRSHPDWWGLPESHAALHGLCGAPLVATDGTAHGLLMASCKNDGTDFSEIDYAMITQLAAIASLALQNLESVVEIKKRAEDLATANSKLEDEVRRRKLAEQILMQYTEDLRSSNEELDSFASTVSHDLQEPLRSIASLVKMLERKYADKFDSTGLEYIARAMESSKRLEAMIYNLLTYSRITTRGKEFEKYDLDRILETAIENLQGSISKTNAVISHTPLPRVYCDESQLVRVFQNIIGNSIKFCEAERPEINVSATKQNAEYVIAITDNAESIEPDYLEQIFDIFSRAPSKLHIAGTGMGLAVCKKILSRHKGRIWAQSEPGKGSTFFFTLPVTDSKGGSQS